jgi:dGTPase
MDSQTNNQKNESVISGAAPKMPRFMLDRDHIFYSKAFRRLAGKAQVYITGENEEKRTRLTHTLEVSQIARSIAQALELDVDLVEAIALGHDLGHTPFGHAGERMLHEIMTVQEDHPLGMPCPLDKTNFKDVFEPYLGFKHNLQSIVVAMQLEKNYEDRGLNLTKYTLYGIQAHSGSEYTEGKVSNHNQLGYYADYLTRGCMLDNNEPAWSLEALLVAQADEIAQWHHDMEDALLGGLITPKELVELMKPILQCAGTVGTMTQEEKDICDNPARYDLGMFTSVFCRTIVRVLMTRLVEIAYQKIHAIGEPEREAVPANVPGANSKIASVFRSGYSPENKTIQELFSYETEEQKDGNTSFAKAVKDFSDEIMPRVLSSHEIQMNDAKGQRIIKKLFQAYYANPQQLPDHCVFEFLSEYHKLKQAGNMEEHFRNQKTNKKPIEVESEKKLREQALEKGIGSVRRIFSKLFADRRKRDVMEELLLMRTICNHIACMTDSEAKKLYDAIYG